MSRVQLEITLGIIFILATSSIILFYGLNEQNRMAELENSQRAQAIEVGAELFDTYCSRCHGTQGLGIQGLCPPLNDRYFFDQRLKDVGWSGSQEDYIVATASSGRLVSTRPETYPGNPTAPAMPAFSDRFGGPLREDQIRNIATFIMNWQETATDVSQAQAPSGPPVGTDITQQLPPGDPAKGEALATSAGCVACHVQAPVGPAWMATADQPGVGTRAATRITEPGYAGKATTPEQYLFESIVLPDAHVEEGFQPGVMPKTFGDTLTPQDMADLIAYLLTLK